MEKKIINATGKTIIIFNPFSKKIIEPTGVEFRETTRIKTTINGVQLIEITTNLPEEKEGTYYIIDPTNNIKVKRRDLLIPYGTVTYKNIQVCGNLLSV